MLSIRGLRLSLVCSLLLCCQLPQETFAKARKTRRISWRFQAPLIAFSGIRGPGLSRLSGTQRATLQAHLRKLVELPRFVPVATPPGRLSRPRYVADLLQRFTKKAFEVARMRAKWSSELQGRKVTSRLLTAVQNNSFAYAIDVQGSLTSGMRITLRLFQLQMFDCAPASQRRSRRHRRACRGKQASTFTGFFRPYKKLVYSTRGVDKSQGKNLFSQMLEGLKNSWPTTLRKRWPVYGPIAWANYHDIYIPLGKREGLRLNQGLKIYVYHIRGHLLYRGFARIRSVGDNRVKLANNRLRRINPKAPYFSRAQTVLSHGALQPKSGMLIKEFPMLGWNIGFSFAMMPTYSELFASTPTVSSLALLDTLVLSPSLSLSFGYDASALFQFNEVHFDLHLELLALSHNDTASNQGAGPAFLASFGMLKKFHWRRLFLVLGARLGLGLMAENEKANEAVSFRVFLLGGEALTGLELFLSPHITLFLRAGFRAYVPLRAASPPLSPYWVLGPFARTGFYFSL